MKRGRGFTILELVLTITLVGVLAVAAISTFSFSPTRLALARDRLVADIRLAHMLAMTSGQTHGIFFNTTTNQYIVFVGTVATPATDPADPSQSLIIDFANDAHFEGVKLTSALFGGLATLTFNAQGTPLASGSVVVGNETGTKTITVSAETGKVSAP